MSGANDNTDVNLASAVSMQREAADPAQSVFVSANAGSGKTRVLVDRVSRILLAGALPDKIICLTYTKAAAAEMQARLFSALGTWSIMSAKKLTDALNTLEDTDRARSEAELGRARRLFARALETPGGLKVQTIHAFCERLLRRFPAEAGLAPGTEAIDEREAQIIQAEVIEKIQNQAVKNPDGEIASAISLLAAHKGDQQLDGLFSWMMNSAYKIKAWEETGGLAVTARALGIDVGLTPEAAIAMCWWDADIDSIKRAADDLAESTSKTDKNARAPFLHEALSLRDEDPALAYETYLKAFFKAGGVGDLFASVTTKQASSFAQDYLGNKDNGGGPEARRILAVRNRVRAAQVLQFTGALYTLAREAGAIYIDLKARRRAADFNDLIYLARDLLADSQARDWVRYKLDGGIDHILVDEAQDTSDTQWQIVDALSEEFFQPSPDRDPKAVRTLFAVGDEKQSIYSFQGARPEAFLDKIQKLSQRDAKSPDVKMSMSFRSSAEILALVDQVFYADKGILDSFDPDTFAPASDVGSHMPRRDAPRGYVEFWPASRPPEKGEAEEAWKPVPVDAPSSQSAREQLAYAIANQIKDWLKTGETVYDAKTGAARLMQPRDIMILVQKRTAFFDAVIRNLKACGVPVAGADRLSLGDAIAVQDLLSLAKFCMLPPDDLSLAEVLKSPLFGWDEEALFAAASGRKGQSLWAAMPEGGDKDALRRIRNLSKRYAPYEFFARVLSITSGSSKKSYLQKIYDRLGLEAADALDAFLARALAHQRRGAPSLAHFIAEMESDAQTIKREMDAGQNEVRVMTVHASKGLEAPLVILPDTTQLPKTGKEQVFEIETETGAGFVMDAAGGKDSRPDALAAIADNALAANVRETMRLFYVALTRAETRLLICGFESGSAKKDGSSTVPQGSWHERAARALSGLDGVRPLETPFGEGLCFGAQPGVAEGEDAADGSAPALPNWCREATPQSGARAPEFLSPSKLFSADDDGAALSVPAASPLDHIITGAQDMPWQGGRFGRGNLIHKLLQILPELAVDRRSTAALAYLNQQGLEGETAQSIKAEVMAVLNHADYAPFFAQGSRAEVSLAGHAKALVADKNNAPYFSGQIDRLCVTKDTVYIIDYKSNRPPPASAMDMHPLYTRQMAAYRALALDLYPGRKIVCALLWTDGPDLMVLPDAMMDAIDWPSILA